MAERMRICHVITRLILGGAQENTILTCEGLRARGHDVTLITGPAIGPEGELMTRAARGGYRLIVLDDLRRAIHPLRDARAHGQLVRLLKEIRPQIVHSHSSKAGILVRRAARIVGGMKVVHTIHGLPFHEYQSWWLNRLYIWLERRAAAGTDAIISVAGAMTRQALAAGVGKAEQYTTIYSGMETTEYLARPQQADEFRASLNLPAGAVLVTQVSRLAEFKGHEYLLATADLLARGTGVPPASSSVSSSSSSSAAAASMQQQRQDAGKMPTALAGGTPTSREDLPPVHFCLVGDGHLRARIEADIERRGLRELVHLTGLLDPALIPAVMHASDIVVHCSLREGLARALPQAMLAGRPVITFAIDGAGEVVDDRTGILLSPRDVEGLVAAIARLACDAKLRQSLGDAGRERCREMFDHNRMVDRIESLYRGLVLCHT